ncbi:hypothetical protein C0991_007539 [Blastosporella zonata]|nr:hypothetical protein C0991_007539 [Blastosporella zonata]
MLLRGPSLRDSDSHVETTSTADDLKDTKKGDTPDLNTKVFDEPPARFTDDEGRLSEF